MRGTRSDDEFIAGKTFLSIVGGEWKVTAFVRMMILLLSPIDPLPQLALLPLIHQRYHISANVSCELLSKTIIPGNLDITRSDASSKKELCCASAVLESPATPGNLYQV